MKFIDGEPTIPVDRDGKPLGGWLTRNPHNVNIFANIRVNANKALLALTTDPIDALPIGEEPTEPIIEILDPV